MYVCVCMCIVCLRRVGVIYETSNRFRSYTPGFRFEALTRYNVRIRGRWFDFPMLLFFIYFFRYSLLLPTIYKIYIYIFACKCICVFVCVRLGYAVCRWLTIYVNRDKFKTGACRRVLRSATPCEFYKGLLLCIFPQFVFVCVCIYSCVHICSLCISNSLSARVVYYIHTAIC